MSTKRQHYVPQVYLKQWESEVKTKAFPEQKFNGVYYFEKKDLEIGEGVTRDKILWKPRLYNVTYENLFMLDACPEIKNDFINKITKNLENRNVHPYYRGVKISTKSKMREHLLNVEEWEFKKKMPPYDLARKKAIISDIKNYQSEFVENMLDKSIETFWLQDLQQFIQEMDNAIPFNGKNEWRSIKEDTAINLVKMIVFLMARSPEFDFFGVLTSIIDLFGNAVSRDKEYHKAYVDFLDRQRTAIWLKELYNGLLNHQYGFIYNLRSSVNNTLQIMLFKTWEGQGSFITSDKPAFAHTSLVEVDNLNSIICPITKSHLVMIAKGEKHSINVVNYRRANNDLIRKFNRIILNNAKEMVVSDSRYLGYLL